jgi:hypothetical protein
VKSYDKEAKRLRIARDQLDERLAAREREHHEPWKEILG